MDPALRGKSPAARHGGPAHDPRGPDVAEDPALVADPVCQPSFFEELVELAPMLRGDLAADLGDPFADVQRLQPP